ncbi:3-ketoacyl-ACP reductase [Clostridia bacterium]|nr:3-ketoacyl-ACP reductase [Clostridia bacterium]
MNKTAIITGAAGGIGKVIAETLAADGYKIAVFDIFDPGDDRVKSAGDLYVKCDVSDFSQCKEAVEKVEAAFGGVYALVNNAGITRDSLLLRMDESAFDSVIAVNLKSVYNMSKLVSAIMLKAREGRIVNISSVAGVYGNAGQTNYSASKAGIIGFTKSLSKEVGSRGITVNAIAPGFIRTPMTEKLDDKAITDKIPLRSLGEPQDVANAAAFLLSENARYITGATLPVDGGLTL